MCTPKTEPNPYQHHYINAVYHLLFNIDGQGYLDGKNDAYVCLKMKLINMVVKNDLTASDAASQAIFDVITEFKLKIDEYEETKNEDLKAEPALSTNKAAQEVIGSDYFAQNESIYFGDEKTKYCFLELVLMAFRKLEINGNATFDLDEANKNNESSIINSYFKGETSEDYSDNFCEFSLPIPMKGVFPHINGESGSHSILKGFLEFRRSMENNGTVYRSMNQKFLIVKLDFSETEDLITPESIKTLWGAIDQEFDTTMLTSNDEEAKGNDKTKAELVAVTTKLSKKNNNNQVVIKIDKKWHMIKTCISLTRDYSEVTDECSSKKHYPLILVYKLTGNFHMEEAVAPKGVALTIDIEDDSGHGQMLERQPNEDQVRKSPIGKRSPNNQSSKETTESQMKEKNLPAASGGCCCTIF